MKKQLLKVTSIYKLTAGSPLAETMTSTVPADGERLSVEAVTDFNSSGGVAVIGTEEIAYSSVDESTDELVGIIRAYGTSLAAAHSISSFVQDGTEASIEKWARGKLDDEDEIRDVPVPSYLYPLLRVGTYSDETAPAIPVYYDEDEDEVIVLDGPVGATPSFDEDLEVLPAVGGGDTSTLVTDPNTGRVTPPAGMGFEDGDTPTTGVTPTVVGGIGTLFIRWPTIANSSMVKYKVHVSTTTGFTPASNTLVGTLDLAGTAGFTGVLPVKDFPTGHVLDGSASDPPVAGTTYYAKVIPSDGSGDFIGPHVEASGTPINVTADLVAASAITSTKIADGSIETPKLAAGAVTAVKIAAETITSNEIAANTIVGGDIAGNTITGGNISGTTITADKLSVSSLSAISANLGTITAGSISSVTIDATTITGGTFRTGTSGRRIYITSSNASTVQFIAGLEGGSIAASVSLHATADSLILFGSDSVRLNSAGPVTALEATSSENRFNVVPRWNDAGLTTNTPGVVLGTAEALPGSSGNVKPFQWLKVRNAGGSDVWVPAWKP